MPTCNGCCHGALWLSRQAVRQIRERRMQPLCCIPEQVLQRPAFAPSLGLLQIQHSPKWDVGVRKGDDAHEFLYGS